MIMYIFLLEVSDFQTFCIWWAVHLVMVGVNVSIDDKADIGWVHLVFWRVGKPEGRRFSCIPVSWLSSPTSPLKPSTNNL